MVVLLVNGCAQVTTTTTQNLIMNISTDAYGLPFQPLEKFPLTLL
jgi:hypothetical protein